MSHDEAEPDRPDELIKRLEIAKDQASLRCQYRTASRLATELKRVARSAGRLEPYAWSLFTLTNHATDLLDPQQGREAAVELIALLESEDRARQIQPDLDLARYEHLVSRMSSCAYDNLGRATALSRGYNSEGLHEAISEGIQVCRRTGKLECITCFREYASDVFRAAEDLPMALHHARHVAEKGNARPGFDRRWGGAHYESEILLLMGFIDAAESAVLRSWELASSNHNPLHSRLESLDTLQTIRILKGDDRPITGLEGLDSVVRSLPDTDEYPFIHFKRDMTSALAESLRGDRAAAVHTLTTWDRRLDQNQCLRYWFEVRLRLIAAYRLAGDEKRVEGLARQLEPKARAARDWLTLRRLARLLDPNEPVSPIAPAGPILFGTAAPVMAASSEPELDQRDDSRSGGGPAESVITPLASILQALVTRRVEESADPASKRRLLEGLLAMGPDLATHPTDVARMLELARDSCDDPSLASGVWNWARTIAAPFFREATVLSILASLGDMLRNAENSQVADRIDAKLIEQLFRQSLDLDPNALGNFGRAAVHYFNAGRTNEAERCLARCVRLDRANARASLWLAEIYGRSDRSNDALAVLDMALRAGSDSPDVAWQAVLQAHSLGQNESMLTYIDQFEKVLPGRPWASFYRASGLVRLGHHEEALEAVDEEERRSRGKFVHTLIMRCCALSALDRVDELRTHLAELLGIRLSGASYLTHQGLVQLFGRLWDAVSILPGEDPLVAGLVDRLLETGLAPNELFGPYRARNAKVEGINFYVCSIVQPLDDRWSDSPGCLPGQEDWTAYRVAWGVLAADEAEAGSVAMEWQARCYPRGAVLEQVNQQGEGYLDHPGIVWQGIHAQAE